MHVAGLKAHNGKILKPFQNKQRGEREHAFYEQVFRLERTKPVFERLRLLIPGYHGMVVVPDSEQHSSDANNAAGSESRDGSASPSLRLGGLYEYCVVLTLSCATHDRALGHGRPDVRPALAVHYGRQGRDAVVRARREC